MNRYALCLIAAITLNMVSNILYKFSSLGGNKSTSAILMAVGLSLGVFNVILYTMALKGIKLNIAYPIFSAGSVIVVFLASFLIFKEALSVKNMLGVLTIAVGIVLVVS